jgi:hypothetical protein
MSLLVESLKRLYLNGKVTQEQLQKMMEDGKILLEEYEYIVN